MRERCKLDRMPSSLLLFLESRAGAHYVNNHERCVHDELTPLYAVIDGSDEHGACAELIVSELDAARADLRAAVAAHDAGEVERRLVRAFETANATIERIPKGQPGYRSGASALALVATRDELIAAHVGMCRLYVKCNGGWLRRMPEHSLYERYSQAGRAHELDHEMRHVVLRVIGVSHPLVVDTMRMPLGGYEQALLCTEGIWRALDPELRAPLLDDREGTEIGPYLMRAYERSGQADDGSIIVARFEQA
jgi:protein phosphatase